MYRLIGSTEVVIVLPSLVRRTFAGLEVELVGADERDLERHRLLLGLASEGHRDDELALVGVGVERPVGLGDLAQELPRLGVGGLLRPPCLPASAPVPGPMPRSPGPWPPGSMIRRSPSAGRTGVASSKTP